MEDISTNVWRHQGSCVVFDRQALGPLIEADGSISLRRLLSWSHSLPPPPKRGATILISGLETMLQILPPQEAHDFLLRSIRPMLIKLQNNWPQCGVVFGFTVPVQAFIEEVMNEEVLYKRGDQESIHLSEGLWDGSATVNMKRIVRETPDQRSKETLGYYVARIS